MKPKLPPRKGYIEAIVNGERVYRDTQTGEVFRPSDLPSEEKREYDAFLERFRKTDEYALIEYMFMMEGLV